MKKTFFPPLIFCLMLGHTFSQAFASDGEAHSPSAQEARTEAISIDEIAEELSAAGSQESDASWNGAAESGGEEELVFEEEANPDSADSESLPSLPENYWRGRVTVAAPNEFPKGLFATAKGYFPGDTLTVINGRTNESTSVLVIGTIDHDDSTGIRFSSEAASAIKISDQTDASVILDERSNPPEVRENASAKLIIFGLDEGDLSSFEQPLSISEDEKILAQSAESEETLSIVDESEAEENENPVLEELVLENLEPLADPSALEANTANPNRDDFYAPIILDLPEASEAVAAPAENAEKEIEPSIKATAAQVPSENEESGEKTSLQEEKICASPTEIAGAEEKKAENAGALAKEAEKALPATARQTVPYKKLIADERMLRPGYYLQLSFLTNEENLQKLVDRHGQELKLFLIPHKNGYKVYAGVFSDDDKDYALDYVKNLGFKDAFARRINSAHP